jgi:amino acid transporter
MAAPAPATKNDIKVISNEPDRSSADDLHSTVIDARDMQRMGKPQELRRNFKYISTLFFVTVLTATWEYLLIANTTGLVDGGRPGLLWTLVWSIAGMLFVTLSLAEMSSMAPASGGQYQWVSEFAPSEYQRFLSYSSGVLNFLFLSFVWVADGVSRMAFDNVVASCDCFIWHIDGWNHTRPYFCKQTRLRCSRLAIVPLSYSNYGVH